MYLSEDLFPHLREAKEQALNRDVERLLVQRERAIPMPTFRSRVKQWSSNVASELRGHFVRTGRAREATCVECVA